MFHQIAHKDSIAIEIINRLNIEENQRLFKEKEICEKQYFDIINKESIAYNKILIAIHQYNELQQ